VHRIVDLLSPQFNAGALLKGLHRLLKLRGLLQKFSGTISQCCIVVGTVRTAANAEAGHHAPEPGGSARLASFGFDVLLKQKNVAHHATAPAVIFKNRHSFLLPMSTCEPARHHEIAARRGFDPATRLRFTALSLLLETLDSTLASIAGVPVEV
jgi:hypothetical protein